ncbi:HERC1 [Symbiodinium natans]|uniref:HERC1 protein n=1 Tax=Symbiodinium natans TaxID=878477 RepID=A0A812P3V7_9DINO|nr:HERC1 [Symbiodinium natans]
MSISVGVALLSGRSSNFEVSPDTRLDELKRRAESALGLHGTLLAPSGRNLDGQGTVSAAQLQTGDQLTLLTRPVAPLDAGKLEKLGIPNPELGPGKSEKLGMPNPEFRNDGGELAKLWRFRGSRFVYVTPTITWVAGVHVGIRIDLFNATALSLRNVGIQLGVSRPTRMGERVGKEGKPWHYPDGLLKPLGSPNIEAITSRSSATLWRDLYLHFPPKPLSLALTLSYTKVLLESSSGLTPMSTPVANSAAEDVWSDDEEGGDRFHFACFPVSMGLSTYFRPFLGFDFPEKVPLPPPLLLASCSQSKTQSAKDLQLPEDWTLRGFHCLSGPGARCLAGIACDNETLLCFILRHSRDSPSLEIRSNNEWLIQAVCDNLMFWILADA